MSDTTNNLVFTAGQEVVVENNGQTRHYGRIAEVQSRYYVLRVNGNTMKFSKSTLLLVGHGQSTTKLRPATAADRAQFKLPTLRNQVSHLLRDLQSTILTMDEKSLLILKNDLVRHRG